MTFWQPCSLCRPPPHRSRSFQNIRHPARWLMRGGATEPGICWSCPGEGGSRGNGGGPGTAETRTLSRRRTMLDPNRDTPQVPALSCDHLLKISIAGIVRALHQLFSILSPAPGPDTHLLRQPETCTTASSPLPADSGRGSVSRIPATPSAEVDAAHAKPLGSSHPGPRLPPGRRAWTTVGVSLAPASRDAPSSPTPPGRRARPHQVDIESTSRRSSSMPSPSPPTSRVPRLREPA